MKVERVTLRAGAARAAFSNGTVVEGATAAAVTQWRPGTGGDADANTPERHTVDGLVAELGKLGVAVEETIWFNVPDSTVRAPAYVVTPGAKTGERRVLYVDVAGRIELLEAETAGRGRAASAVRFPLGPGIEPPAARYATSALGAFFLVVVTIPSGGARGVDSLARECWNAAKRVFGVRQDAESTPPVVTPVVDLPTTDRGIGASPDDMPTRGRRPMIGKRVTRGMRGITAPPPSPPRAKAPAPVKAVAPGAPKRTAKSAKRTARPEVNVSRRPDIEFHELVVAGETHPLVVRLSEAISDEELATAFDVVVPAGQDTVKLSVTLSAPGFEVTPREQPLTVGRTFDKKREQVTFSLRAQEPAGGKPAKRDIRADIWLGNASIGGVTHWTTVVPKGYKGRATPSGESRSSPFEIGNPGRACELVVRVQGRDELGSPPYEVSLRSRIPNEPEYESRRVGMISFSRAELAATLQEQFARFADTHPAHGNKAALKQWRASLLEEIDTLGKWLWTKLPEDFRTEYFRLHKAGHLPASILVHSDEMLIPWELIVPHQDGKVLPRLGIAHVMGRWRPALGLRPRPQRLTVTAATIANPKYGGDSLVWSILEAAALKEVVPAFQTMRTVTRSEMAKVLKRTDVQFLHFTGHGKYAKHADLSTLMLEGGDTVTAMNFVASALLTKAHAIVYLNACEVGNSGVVMGQMGGFAAQCVENGCSGMVAPYWAVADESAGAFAKAFYEKLQAGRAIGEALQELRKEKPKDPTYQAFAYLGDPYTQPQFQ